MRRRITTIVFDLDDTLVMEMESEERAFMTACAIAAERYAVDPHDLFRAVRRRAKELWHASPWYPYCQRIGFASWEGLWSTFSGSSPEMRELRAWAPTYHREAWRRALEDVGVADLDLAECLSETYKVDRRSRHVVFEDAIPALEDLRKDFRLGLLTNGAEDVQQTKLDGSGLAGYFDAILITGAIGIGKPYPEPFRAILGRLKSGESESAMVGDSLSSDIAGARRIGMFAVRIRRRDSGDEDDRADVEPDATIRTLAELRKVLP